MSLRRTCLGLCLSAVVAYGSSGCTVAINSSPAGDEITAVEIQQANVATAYEAVDRLRHAWFGDPYDVAYREVKVYADPNVELGAKDALRDILANDVVEIRYLTAAQAMARFGPDACGGAIVVVRR